MANNFTDAFRKAGVNVPQAKPVMTLGEAHRLSAMCKEDEPVYSNEAMKQLPDEFSTLKEVSDGREFMEELTAIVDSLISSKKGDVITEHVIFGITQLAHYQRDHLSGSKRRSFKEVVIPTLLEAKTAMKKKNPDDLADFFLRFITKV